MTNEHVLRNVSFKKKQKGLNYYLSRPPRLPFLIINVFVFVFVLGIGLMSAVFTNCVAISSKSMFVFEDIDLTMSSFLM